ncbi:hypothetical protein L917_00340 [Phytophthora nicotianae]|uniref:DDE-1 domain-containing protein n=3 Tax=Phytophthora nicotianae TaxID=4792 RepID=V9G0P7_PHYNI|nr:hypothetical protein F443_00402 [Phytophthora nicotianae P1569]ETM03444.1 hypothetical protein L917_00340 [Phytophthora nicotianae]ETM56711.1 hypothetical protein L914_00362 [Phytophthora nicotianae]
MLRRFMERRSSFTFRTSQSAPKYRNEVEKQDLSALFSSLSKVVIEHNIDADLVFNVDQTAINTARKHKLVIAAKGSLNVRHKDINAHFQPEVCSVWQLW